MANIPTRELAFPKPLNQLTELPVIESATGISYLIAGFVTFSSFGLGSLLLFITSLLGIRSGWQELDPAIVLPDLEERENKKRRVDDQDKSTEEMFGG